MLNFNFFYICDVILKFLVYSAKSKASTDASAERSIFMFCFKMGHILDVSHFTTNE